MTDDDHATTVRRYAAGGVVRTDDQAHAPQRRWTEPEVSGCYYPSPPRSREYVDDLLWRTSLLFDHHLVRGTE